MSFTNLCGIKAVGRSVEQLKFAKIAVILLLCVQIIDAGYSIGAGYAFGTGYTYGSGQYGAGQYGAGQYAAGQYGAGQFGVIEQNLQSTETPTSTSTSTSTTKAARTTTTIPTFKSNEADSYCSMCKSHVACKKNDSFGAACSDDAELVLMDQEQKETILKIHNKLRNKIAMGEMKEFSPAAKMPCFQWDDELAKLAEINARSCVFKHDTCRATKRFPFSGQNLARRYNNLGYEDKDIAIEEMITKWFAENKDADMSYIKSYHNQKKGKQIGHFTIMINDKNNAVGCASTKYYSNGNYYRYLVCNYGFTNVLTRPVYEDGATGSKCVKRHPIYPGLCSTEQVVIPVP